MLLRSPSIIQHKNGLQVRYCWYKQVVASWPYTVNHRRSMPFMHNGLITGSRSACQKHYCQKYVVIDTKLLHFSFAIQNSLLHRSTEEQLVLCLPYTTFGSTNQEAGKETKATSEEQGYPHLTHHKINQTCIMLLHEQVYSDHYSSLQSDSLATPFHFSFPLKPHFLSYCTKDCSNKDGTANTKLPWSIGHWMSWLWKRLNPVKAQTCSPTSVPKTPLPLNQHSQKKKPNSNLTDIQETTVNSFYLAQTDWVKVGQ